MQRRTFLKSILAITGALVAAPKLLTGLFEPEKPKGILEMIQVNSFDYSSGAFTIKRFNESFDEIFAYQPSTPKYVIMTDKTYKHLSKVVDLKQKEKNLYISSKLYRNS